MPSGIRRRKIAKSKTNKVTRRTRDKQAKTPVIHDAIVAKHWDAKLTMAQNYAKLGLKVKLDKVGKTNNFTATVQEGRIVRSEDGSVEVVYTKPEVQEAEEEEEVTETVKELVERSRNVVKTERHQSEREQEWIAALYKKHGTNYEKMFWDKKLNIYQQSVGDLKKRVTKWLKIQSK